MEDAEVARPRERGVGGVVDTSGLDQDTLDDMEAIFGSGEDYGWALDLEAEEEHEKREEQAIELKDVFEPSQLQEKLLTDEDNEIRFADEPERFQIDRKPFKNLHLTDEQFREEAKWISSQLWPKKAMRPDLQQPFNKAVGKVLEFFIVDTVEVPFVFQHRKDYLLHNRKARSGRDDADGGDYHDEPDKLLNQDDLWKVLELDIKFRSFVEKRNSLEKTFEGLKAADVDDRSVEEMIPEATSMEEIQDLQDYLQFRYAQQLKDLALTRVNGNHVRRPGSKSSLFDRARSSRVAYFVKAYGLTADQLAKNALRQGPKVSPDDDSQYPMDLADSLVDENFPTGDQVIHAARQIFSEELYVSPRMRKHFRNSYYQAAEISCRRTDKGLRRIDESHPYYEIKYLQNQAIADFVGRPELFLKMMKAEEEGLIEIKLEMPARYDFKRQLYQEFESENYSDRAEQWRDERKKVLDAAYARLEKITAKNVKETIRTFCQDEVLKACREEYARRLDQAPYKPKGMILGTLPRVLVISNGMGDSAREPVFWTWVDEEGRMLEQGSFTNLARDDKSRAELVELVQRRRPDVIGVSGWSATTHKLVRDLETLVNEKDLQCAEFEDPETGEYRTEPLEVMVINDEVARLYKDSPRALSEYPSINPVLRYCVALARYMQNPMKEYAALGKDVISLSWHPCQNLLPQDRLAKYLESAMVDMVNLCGVDINEAVTDPYTANLLPFIAGLGPRKATSVMKAINANGGSVNNREELVGDPSRGKLPVVGPRVWINCASFLFLEYETGNPKSDPLDNTRVHPEDYELGRKMAADALELDEEDVKAEVDDVDHPSAIVQKLFRQQEQDKVNELVLEEYADQLLRNFSQRKRATLETIRAELQAPYEELRRNFTTLSSSEIFTMFTGETKESLCEGMIVPVNVRVVRDDFAIVKLDCGIEGRAEAHEISLKHSPKELLSTGQTLQAKLTEIDYKDFVAKVSVREDTLREKFRRPINYGSDGWDFRQENEDKEELREKDQKTGRTQRVVKHPNFKPFNATQAEEYLGSQPSGEVIIRPSSKGNDHLAVTWKVADNVYQHIDVLEMQKENEFAVGKLLRVGKYTYSDLDELIVEHVKAMARKVEEMMRHDKYQGRSRVETGKSSH